MLYLDSENVFPLHWACFRGNKNEVERLLKDSFDPNQSDFKGGTALHVACRENRLDCARLLLQRGANIDAEDVYKWKPLHYACVNEYLECIELLIKNGANVNALDDEKWTALHLACRNGNLECAKLLLQNGANVNTEDAKKTTPLHFACLNLCKKCSEILIKNKAERSFENFNVMALLHTNCAEDSTNIDSLYLKGRDGKYIKINLEWKHSEDRKNEIDYVKLLLDGGADIEAKEESNLTPLHIASIHGYFEAVKLILKRGVDVNSIDKTKSTALHYANMHGHVDIVKLLLEYGSDIHLKNNSNLTAWNLAVKYRHGAELSMLKGTPPDPLQNNLKLKDNSSVLLPSVDNVKYVEELELRTALLESSHSNKDYILQEIVENVIEKESDLLHYVLHNNFKMAEKYIQDGVNLNTKNLDGKTCLHICVENKYTNLFLMLVRQQSLDINVVDKNNQTCLHYAVLNNQLKMVKVLISHGINLNAKDSNGKTCLHLCVENNLMDLFLFLIRQRNLDINAVDRKSQTCLHYAVEQDNLDMALVLIAEGIDIKARNFYGRTALQLANQLDLTNMVYLLNDYGANVLGDETDLDSDSEQENFSMKCRICLERRIDRVFVNCGHTSCNLCITQWRQVSPNCPYCRAKVLQVLKFFNS